MYFSAFYLNFEAGFLTEAVGYSVLSVTNLMTHRPTEVKVNPLLLQEKNED